MNLRPLAYVAVGGLIGVIGAGIWKAIYSPTRPAVVESALPPLPTAGQTASTPDLSAPPADSTPRATPPIKPPRPQPQAVQEMENVQFMFRDFRTRMGGNPVGTNAEIMKSVMGDNPFQARLGPPDGQSLNEAGELLDHWGTPYFFHQQSKDKMEIRSAGPDRQMWTADDVMVK